MSHMRRTGKRKQYAQGMRDERATSGRTYRTERKHIKQAKHGTGAFGKMMRI